MTTTAESAALRDACAHEIDKRTRGHFNNRPWLREAYLHIPREHFVPDRVWQLKKRHCTVLDRATQPEEWLAAIYQSRAPLITQVSDGTVRIEDGPTYSTDFTSSISCSAVVVDMLHYLDPQPGDRVLEIGTGTGYSTALLCHRVGAENVVSIEIDKGLAEAANARLRRLGLHPLVVTADGEDGYSSHGPYDRIISTAAVRKVPQVWLHQARKGTVIVTPIDTPYGCDGLLRLVCDGAGSAEGRLHGGLSFMKLRGQRERLSYGELGWPEWDQLQVQIGPDGQKVRAP